MSFWASVQRMWSQWRNVPQLQAAQARIVALNRQLDAAAVRECALRRVAAEYGRACVVPAIETSDEEHVLPRTAYIALWCWMAEQARVTGGLFDPNPWGGGKCIVHFRGRPVAPAQKGSPHG